MDDMKSSDVCVLATIFVDGHLMLAHRFKGNILRGFSDSENLAGVFAREKSFGNDHEQINGRTEHQQRHQQD